MSSPDTQSVHVEARGSAREQNAQRTPSASPLKRSLITAFCLFHMGAVVIFNLPQRTALGDLRAPLSWYASLTWLNQEWGMFTTIPHYARLSPVLVAKYSEGADTVHGPMLPGLTAYPHDLRALYLALHTLWPAGEFIPLAYGYLDKACQAIAKHTGRKPRAVALRVEARVLVPLAQVRARHKLGKRERQWSKEVQCR